MHNRLPEQDSEIPRIIQQTTVIYAEISVESLFILLKI